MKLAMLSFRLPSVRAKRGGVDRVAHDLAHGLALRGHQVTVWSADPLPADAAYTVRELPFRRFLDHPLGFRLTSGYLGNLLALLPSYRGAQAIIAHGDSLLLPFRGIPVLRIMHGSALDEARTAKSPLRKAAQFGVYLQEKVTAATQSTVAISRNTRARYPSVREVIPNGVDTTRFFPEPTAKTSHPSILFVGTLGGRKRGHLLLDWFQTAMRPAFPDATLWMVSEPGPAIPGVGYFSGIPSEQLARLYRSAWIYASPSLYEGFGLPYLEAMASGTPVIATANPGSCEVLEHNHHGILVENDRDFPDALRQLLANSCARNHWTAQGLHRAEQLSLDRQLDRYESVLAALIARAISQEAQA